MSFAKRPVVVPAATVTVAGKVELATIAETTTGTDTTRAVTPYALAGSEYGERTQQYRIIGKDTALTTGDNKGIIQIPAAVDGWNIVGVYAHVDTPSTSGLPSFQLYNLDDTQDILTTNITIDENEYSSHSAATPPVIDTGKDDVNAGERLRADCDVAGTGTKGLTIEVKYRLP